MSSKITIGFAGLGKMGKNIVLNMKDKGYEVVAFNRSKAPLNEVVSKGAIGSNSLADMTSKLNGRKIVWIMFPAGEVTDKMVIEVGQLLSKGDILIDGSNSNYKDSRRHYDYLHERGILMLDAGCSGGPSGARSGMSIMVGGDEQAYRELEGVLKDLSVQNGLLYTGPAGSGHFVKMVHNAIEYGMMESIAEGMDLVANGPYKDLKLADICRLWNHGSVIRGYLIELTARAIEKDGKLKSIEPYVEDTGEGRWSVDAAVEHAIPFAAISASLFERFRSRSDENYSHRLLAALRHEFGGHAVKEA